MEKNNLFILISTRIIEPEVTGLVDDYTQNKLEEYYETIENFHEVNTQRDPIYKRFFESPQEGSTHLVEDFLQEAQSKRGDQKGKTLATRPNKFYQMQPSVLSSPLADQPNVKVSQNKRPNRRDARRSKSHKGKQEGVVA